MPKEDDLEYYKEIYRALIDHLIFTEILKILNLNVWMKFKLFSLPIFIARFENKKIYDFGAGNGDLVTY